MLIYTYKTKSNIHRTVQVKPPTNKTGRFDIEKKTSSEPFTVNIA